MRSFFALLAVALGAPAARANPVKVDACRVIAAPFEYAGKTVEVSGIYVGGVEQSYLTGGACAGRHIVVPNRFDASSFHDVAGRRLVFRGTVRLVPERSGSLHVIPWLDNPVFVDDVRH